MAILNKEILGQLGIQLTEEEYASLAEHFESTLDERVINEIVLSLTPEQAQELSTLQQSNDDELLAWLQSNVPELSDIVADEVDILLGELAEHSDHLD